MHGFRFLLLCKILSQPRWHQMLQPSLFPIPFPKFEGNLRLSVENQEKRAELLNSLSLLRLRSEVKNRPSSNGLARFLRDESGSSEGLVWLKARGVLVISIVNRNLALGGDIGSFNWQEMSLAWTLFIPVFEKVLSDDESTTYQSKLRIRLVIVHICIRHTLTTITFKKWLYKWY